MVQPPPDLTKFEALLEIVKALRGPEGCPWDKEQTHQTLTPYAIEEAHELAEAIELGDQTEMVSELGDLLLQVVLHAEIGRQEGRFSINDVVQAISEKMVRRHPHVFSTTEVSSSADVLNNWAKVKAAEKAQKAAQKKAQKGAAGAPESERRFDIALSLPALARSQKIGDKTKRLRFDWSTPFEVMAKVDEEVRELKEEMIKLDGAASPELKKALEHELGDLLFSAAQLARHLGLDAEQCLRTTNTRFETRFFTMNEMIKESGKEYDQLSNAELEDAWQRAKRKLKDEAKKEAQKDSE